jgi:hypothetical protein
MLYSYALSTDGVWNGVETGYIDRYMFYTAAGAAL